MAFILSGCGATEESQEPAPTTSAAASTPTTTAAAADDPETIVCDYLAGKDMKVDRPLADIVTIKHDALGEGYNPLDLTMALVYLKTTIPEANGQMQPLLEDLREPLKEIEDADSTGDAARPHWEDFDAAAVELSEICDIELPDTIVAPLETPTPVETSGDYGADLAAAGTVPDDVDSFGEFMSEYLCDSDLQGTGFGTLSNNVRRFGEPGQEEAGYGPAVVRLTVAYYCPERADAAEEALAEHGYDS